MNEDHELLRKLVMANDETPEEQEEAWKDINRILNWFKAIGEEKIRDIYDMDGNCTHIYQYINKRTQKIHCTVCAREIGDILYVPCSYCNKQIRRWQSSFQSLTTKLFYHRRCLNKFLKGD